jgi:diacylglycerol kinase
MATAEAPPTLAAPIGTAAGARAVGSIPHVAPGLPGMEHDTLVGRAAFFKSFVYAWNGLIYAIRTQRNARVHALIGCVAIAMGIWLQISPVEFAMVFVAITGVFIAEMFNTVAEACVDLITDQYHPLARIAKDVAAGAVLFNAMLSVVIGLFVYLPHLEQRYGSTLLHLFGR